MSKWKLQFEENWAEGLRPDKWYVLHGKWIPDWKDTDDGLPMHMERWLCGGEPGDPLLYPARMAVLSLLLHVPGDQRVEFDAMGGEWLGDLTCILNTHPRKGHHVGYMFAFGCKLNKGSQIRRPGTPLYVHNTLIERGKRYHIVCEREGDVLTHIINGEIVARCRDAQPLNQPGHDTIALYIHAQGRMTNIKVYNKGEPCEWFDPPSEEPCQKVIPSDELVAAPEDVKMTCFRPRIPLLYYGGLVPPYQGAAGEQRWRDAAKRFGTRFVLEERYDSARENDLVISGGEYATELWRRRIKTRTAICDLPGPKGFRCANGELIPPIMPNNRIWRLDPRWTEQVVKSAEYRARRKNHWAMTHPDELWHQAIMEPPRDQWYPQIEEADREVRERYGFGKYGIPHGDESLETLPFSRIAYRRWASDQLAERFKRVYRVIKHVDPDIKIVGPTDGGSGAGGDLEQWSRWFDINGCPAIMGPSSAYCDAQRVGLMTKIYSDLSCGRPVWMMVHTAGWHAARCQPDDIREAYGQVLRNGGENVWLMGTEFWDKQLGEALFADPHKWRAMQMYTKYMRCTNRPTQPTPDTAILWPTDSLLAGSKEASLRSSEFRIDNCYSVLGPILGGAFKFVSDIEVGKWSYALHPYKTLYVPYAPYVRESVFRNIQQFAERGGMVVVTDPDAFTWDIDGTRRTLSLAKFTGLVMGDQRKLVEPMAVSGQSWSVLPGRHSAALPGVVVTATFQDGEPYIAMQRYGTGHVISFAADPFTLIYGLVRKTPLFPHAPALDRETKVTPDAPIVRLVRGIQEQAGCKLGHSIWNKTLPRIPDPHEPVGTCLTDNAPPHSSHANIGMHGAAGELQVNEEGWVDFRKSILTSRNRAYATRGQRKVILDDGPWTLKFGEPLQLLLRFGNPYEMGAIHLIYSGVMPDGVVSYKGGRSRRWRQAGRIRSYRAGKDVEELMFVFDEDIWAEEVRLRFDAPPKGEDFELCEIEVWSASDADRGPADSGYCSAGGVSDTYTEA